MDLQPSKRKKVNFAKKKRAKAEGEICDRNASLILRVIRFGLGQKENDISYCIMRSECREGGGNKRVGMKGE